MTDDSVVKELNAFLKGRYMGIRVYEHFIQKLNDPTVKKQFQAIQQEHKLHAQKVAERIQNLGGVPVDDEGLVGSVQGFISKFTLPDTTEGIIETASKGEDHYAVHLSEEIVKGDLDPESLQLVKDILNKDRLHVELLKNLRH